MRAGPDELILALQRHTSHLSNRIRRWRSLLIVTTTAISNPLSGRWPPSRAYGMASPRTAYSGADPGAGGGGHASQRRDGGPTAPLDLDHVFLGGSRAAGRSVPIGRC